MGAWGHGTFDNDDACDFGGDMTESNDLSPVEQLFDRIEQADEYVDASDGGMALAACEVLARLKGYAGYHNSYTEDVDAWVAAHPMNPPASLVNRGVKIIDRVLSEQSELRDLWEETDDAEPWKAAVADLRSRLTST